MPAKPAVHVVFVEVCFYLFTRYFGDDFAMPARKFLFLADSAFSANSVHDRGQQQAVWTLVTYAPDTKH